MVSVDSAGAALHQPCYALSSVTETNAKVPTRCLYCLTGLYFRVSIGNPANLTAATLASGPRGTSAAHGGGGEGGGDEDRAGRE